MNPAQNTVVPDDNNNTPVSAKVNISSSTGKEHEALRLSATESVTDISQEAELPREVEKAGVEIIKDTIELPPDVKKLGVTQTGPSTPVIISNPLPQVTLPISDQTVVVGLHAQILSSLRWLAIWCIRRLKKAHIALKEIHGKIVRVKN